MKNVRKHSNFIEIDVRTKFSYYKVFHRKFISNRHEKTEILMNKPVILGLSILGLSKILLYEFWYDYVKPKYGEKAKLCFIVYIKAGDIYKDIVKYVNTRFDPSNYELDRPLPKAKNKTKIMTKFVRLTANTYI